MDCSVAAVEVSTVEAEMVPGMGSVTCMAAVTVAVPAAVELARPLVAALKVTEGLDELQVTAALRSWVELSENVPVAVNCLLVPAAITGLIGSMAIDTSVAEVTVKRVLPETAPEVAVTVVAPGESEVARPGLWLAKVATAGLSEVQVTEPVRSLLELSE